MVHDNAASPDDAVIADFDSGYDDAVSAYEASLADSRVEMAPFDEIMGQDSRAKRDDSLIANMDAARVGLIQFCRKRDLNGVANIHSPEEAEIGASRLEKEGPYPGSEPGDQGNGHKAMNYPSESACML